MVEEDSKVVIRIPKAYQQGDDPYLDSILKSMSFLWNKENLKNIGEKEDCTEYTFSHFYLLGDGVNSNTNLKDKIDSKIEDRLSACKVYAEFREEDQ